MPEEVEEEVKEKKKVSRSWLANLDSKSKMLFFGVIGLLLWQTKVRGIPVNNAMIYIALIGLLVYLLTSGAIKKEGYTAAEAEQLVVERENDLVKDRNFPYGAMPTARRTTVISHLRHNNMRPKDYVIGRMYRFADGAKKEMQWTVDYMMGNPTQQRPSAELTGLEWPDKKWIVQDWVQEAERKGLYKWLR